MGHPSQFPVLLAISDTQDASNPETAGSGHIRNAQTGLGSEKFRYHDPKIYPRSIAIILIGRLVQCLAVES
jgi:hypothetical protein